MHVSGNKRLGAFLAAYLTASLSSIACNSESPGDGTGGDVTGGDVDGGPDGNEVDPDGAEGADGADETTGPLFEPDASSCLQGTCTDDVDCCLGVQAALGLPQDPATCPGNYPNNWTCDGGVCVHGGCTVNNDCGHPSLACKQIEEEGIQYCVTVCDPEAEAPCGPESMHLVCSGTAFDDTKFCIQDPPPPPPP